MKTEQEIRGYILILQNQYKDNLKELGNINLKSKDWQSEMKRMKSLHSRNSDIAITLGTLGWILGIEESLLPK